MKISLIKYGTIGGLLLNLMLALTAALVCFFIYCYVYLGRVTHHGKFAKVPDLRGLSAEELPGVLKEKHLRFDIADSAYDEKLPPHTVMYQFPKADAQVKIDRLIHITLNSGKAPTLPMPDLVDKSFINAKVVLESSSLKLGKVTYAPSPYPYLVLAMQRDGLPVNSGDRLPKGAVIDLIIGDGGARGDMTMGNLVNETYERALLKLKGWRLNLGTVSVVEGQDTTGREAFVVRQNPVAGDSVRTSSPIDLWIAPAGYKIPKE